MRAPEMRNYFLYIVMAIGFLTIPGICLAYVKYRLPARQDQLTSLFKSDGILPAYLATRGQRPPKQTGESEEDYHKRLVAEFDRVFSLELAQEYGLTLYYVPIVAASLTTIVVLFYLLNEAAGQHLLAHVPISVSYSLLGAFAGSVYSVISRYSLTELNPTSLWWIPFRYLIAVAYGLFANMIFNETFAGLGSFMLGMVQITEALNFVRSRIGIATANAQDSGFRLIQGLDPATIDTLVDLGVSHTQHLAYVDPLKLLLRSNFSPNQLADLMDQCFLFNYVGSKIETLRASGIRGAIEVADLQDLRPQKRADMVAALAEHLEIKTAEADNLIGEMAIDPQLELIEQIWGSVDLETSEAESSARSPLTANSSD